MTPPARDQIVMSLIKGGPLMVALMLVLAGVWYEVDKLREGYQANTITVREATAENIALLGKAVDMLATNVKGMQAHLSASSKAVSQANDNGQQILKLMQAATETMKPMAKLREDQNQLLREIKEELQKK